MPSEEQTKKLFLASVNTSHASADPLVCARILSCERTQAPNATKRYHQTQALMGATRLEAAEKCPDAGQGKLL